jgi:hypothetical protein
MKSAGHRMRSVCGMESGARFDSEFYVCFKNRHDLRDKSKGLKPNHDVKSVQHHPVYQKLRDNSSLRIHFFIGLHIIISLFSACIVRIQE